MHLNLRPNLARTVDSDRTANSDRTRSSSAINQNVQSAPANAKEPIDTFKLADQNLLNQINSLTDMVRSQVEQFNELKERLDSMETRLLGDGHNESSVPGTVAPSDPNGSLMLKVAEKLSDYNYTKWAKSIWSQLESAKLHIFLRHVPKQVERAINLDRKIQESIRSTITPKAAARINLNSFQYTKNLWDNLREHFHENLLNRIESNITFLTRTDVETLGEVDSHVNRFRTAVLELAAVDYEIGENVLIELLLSSLPKEPLSFRVNMRNQIRGLSLDYERSLKHVSVQALFCIQFMNRDSVDSQRTLLDD